MYIDIVATLITTMVWDEWNEILIFLALQIARKSGMWINYLKLLSNFVALKSVLVSTFITYLSNLYYFVLITY